MVRSDGSLGPAVTMVANDAHPAWVAELPDYSATFTLVATDAAGTGWCRWWFGWQSHWAGARA